MHQSWLPNMKNQIPESNTPSNIGRREERTGRSCPGYNILYITKKISAATNPITKITHEEDGYSHLAETDLFYLNRH